MFLFYWSDCVCIYFTHMYVCVCVILQSKCITMTAFYIVVSPCVVDGILADGTKIVVHRPNIKADGTKIVAHRPNIIKANVLSLYLPCP